MSARRLSALALLLAASGCASFSAGPAVVGSSRLGYESPYFGARIVVSAQSERLSGRVEVLATDARKIGGGSGGGASARAVLDPFNSAEGL